MTTLFNALSWIGILFLVIMLFNLVIVVHEWGHFLAARWRGLKIDKFQIWFGKPIWKKTINGVQYGLGTIPFGGFVALTNWLNPYYVSTYQTSVATAGLLTSFFTVPSSLIRAAGGWMSDRWGARTMMYWVLLVTAIGCGLLSVPRMSIETPGEGILATAAGTVTRVTDSMIVIGAQEYRLRARSGTDPAADKDAFMPLPVIQQWHAPLVVPGQKVERRQLLASGVTHIFFQANVTIFTVLLFMVGTAMGVGMAAVFKHIPVYFPSSVGVTGGIVGVIGGLGGMVCPILFGYLLNLSGLWTSCWMFLGITSVVCLVWMHVVIQRMLAEQAPQLAQRIDR